MDSIGLTAFDLAAIAIILISSIMAFARGLLREVFSIVALLGAVVMVVLEANHRILTPIFEGFIKPPVIASVATWIVVFLATFIIINIITAMLAKAAHSSGEIGAIDRGAGLLFGAARGILVLALAVLLVNRVTTPERQPTWLTDSKTYPVLSQVADAIAPLISVIPGYIEQQRNPESGAAPT